jgi:hypothetical protein
VDEESRRVAESLAAYMDEVVHAVRGEAQEGTVLLAEVLAAHLGTDPGDPPVVAAEWEPFQLVNLDVAMATLVDRHGGGRLIGVGGGDQRHHTSFGDMIQSSGRWVQFPVAAVERVDLATGPDTQRQAIAFGVHLFRFDQTPVAVLQRQGDARPGAPRAGSGRRRGPGGHLRLGCGTSAAGRGPPADAGAQRVPRPGPLARWSPVQPPASAASSSTGGRS